MKRWLICIIVALGLFPVSAHADVGVDIRFVVDGTGAPAMQRLRAGTSNPPGNEYILIAGGYDTATGFRVSAPTQNGTLQWRQPSGAASGPLYLYDGSMMAADQCIDARYPDFATRVPGMTLHSAWSGAEAGWVYHDLGSFALAEAPYPTVTVTIPGTIHPVDDVLSAQELDFLARVNIERARLGRSPLKIDTRLNQAADSHVHWTERVGYRNSHCGIYRSQVRWRVFEALGTAGSAYDEVASWHQVTAGTTISGERAWMGYKASLGHYKALTSAELSCIGIGFSVDSSDARTVADLAGGITCNTEQVGVLLAPLQIPKPLVVGTAAVGRTLTCALQAIPGAIDYEYEWKRGNTIAEYGARYDIDNTDIGQQLSCGVIVHTDTGATDEVWSDAVTVKASPRGLIMLKSPSVIGSAKAGKKVTCFAGRWNAPVRVTRSWQLRRGQGWVKVGSQAGLRVSGLMRGRQLRCVVAVRKVSGTGKAQKATRAVRVAR